MITKGNVYEYVTSGKHLVERLELRAAESRSVIGLMGYWTLGPSYIPNMFEKLKDENSFICIDPSPPTELCMLLKESNNGSNIYIAEATLSYENQQASLMHSKMLLFDIDETTAELWVGSHNMTKRAMHNINIEHTFITPIHKINDKELYNRVYDDINYVKDNYCIRINSHHCQHLKEKEFITLIGSKMDNLQNQIILILFSHFKKLPKSNLKGYYLLAYDIEKLRYFAYESIIEQSGNLLGEKELREIEFGDRRYALKDGHLPAYLFPSSPLDISPLNDRDYFVNLHVGKSIDLLEVFESVDQKEDVSDQIQFLMEKLGPTIGSKVKINPSLLPKQSFNLKGEIPGLKLIEKYYDPTTDFMEKQSIWEQLKKYVYEFIKKLYISK